jgi:hypothetical protein
MPKISELNALTSVLPTDLIVVAHDVAGLPSTNKITVSDFAKSLQSAAGTGNVVIYSSDGSHSFTWNFDNYGSIELPALLSGTQGNGNLDVKNNAITLNASDTVDFRNFSGMIIVNSHNNGGTAMYLCGGTGTALLGNTNIASKGSMAFNSGISGYTFTASESGEHVFFVVRTRSIG